MKFAGSLQQAIAFSVCLLAVTFACSIVSAQGYIFAESQNNPDIVTHPIGYTGAGAVLNITVGIDPTSAFAGQMGISVQNVVNTWNGLNLTTGNIQFGVIAGGEIDFESVLLHEMGHSIGLAHVNLATESGQAGANQNYSKAFRGGNGVYDLNAGTDGIIGSADDLRGDDINLNYFEIGVNNPFALNAGGIFDSTTYSNDLADLPIGDNYVANADRAVSALYGVPDTEGAMQQGSFFGEVQRTLAGSDIVGIRYAMSGIDELQGTADDYVLNLDFVGLDAGADIVIDFDNAQTGFAVSQSGATFLNGTHLAITSNSIFFNSGFNWVFNDTLAVPEPGTGLILLGIAGIAGVIRRKRIV